MSNYSNRFFADDLHINNKSPRMPVCLLIETVHEHSKARIENQLKPFLEKLINNKTLRNSVELSVITYGYDPVNQIKEVIKMQLLEGNIDIELKGYKGTGLCCLNEALQFSTDKIFRVLKGYKEFSLSYYRPVLVIFSFGDFNDISEAKDKILPSVKAGRIDILPASDKKELAVFSNGKLINLNNIEELFEKITQSLTKLSRSSSDAYGDFWKTGVDWEEIIKQ